MHSFERKLKHEWSMTNSASFLILQNTFVHAYIWIHILIASRVSMKSGGFQIQFRTRRTKMANNKKKDGASSIDWLCGENLTQESNKHFPWSEIKQKFRNVRQCFETNNESLIVIVFGAFSNSFLSIYTQIVCLFLIVVLSLSFSFGCKIKFRIDWNNTRLYVFV